MSPDELIDALDALLEQRAARSGFTKTSKDCALFKLGMLESMYIQLLDHAKPEKRRAVLALLEPAKKGGKS